MKEKELIQEIVRIIKLIENGKSDFKKNLKKLKKFLKKSRFTNEELEIIFSKIKLINNLHIQLREIIEFEEDYDLNYGQFFKREKGKENIFQLYQDFLHSKSNGKIKIAHKAAKYSMKLGDWEIAIKILKKAINDDVWDEVDDKIKSAILRDLGISITKSPQHQEINKYEEGQNYIKEAIKLDPDNIDALCSMAGTFKNIGTQKAHEEAYKYYLKALKKDPYHSYPLGNVLIYEINKNGLSSIEKRKTQIEKAIKRREKECVHFQDVPWSFFDVATLSLYLGDIEKSMKYYLIGIRLCNDHWPISTTFNTLSLINNVDNDTFEENLKNIKKLLLLGRGFLLKDKKDRNPDEKELFNDTIENLNNLGLKKHDFPSEDKLIIIAGSINPYQNKEKAEIFKASLEGCLKDYKGIVICGAPKGGMPKIVEALTIKYKSNLGSYIYFPKGKNYSYEELQISEKFITDNIDYSMEEIFQYWYDILRFTKIRTRNIKLLGFCGDKFSYFEYLMGMMFGSHVGLIRDSGGAVNSILNDLLLNKLIYPGMNKWNVEPIRLYNLLDKNFEDIEKFMNSKFFSNLDNENIKIIVIQDDGGTEKYYKEISASSIDKDKITYLISLINSVGRDIMTERGGEIKWDYSNFILEYIFKNKILVAFILNDNPSFTLKEKIHQFNHLLDEDYKDILDDSLKRSTLLPDDIINQLLIKVFGDEIV